MTHPDSHFRKSIVDREENLKLNRQRWGNEQLWSERDRYGYQWAGGVLQCHSSLARLTDRFLRPYLNERYDLKILELAPGAGRFTFELIRYAAYLDLLDMNEACLNICRSRLSYLPLPVRFFRNDGQSCDILEDHDYDLIASFDSMVHVHPDIIAGYVRQLGVRLKSGGILWLDHSGKGPRETGHRTDMTPEKMATFAAEAGLDIIACHFRNDHDCISVARRP